MLHSITGGPSRRDATALVSLPKYIKKMPRQRNIQGRLRRKTNYIYDSAGSLTGLTIDAHAPEDTERHGETIQIALIWRNEPIRHIDWEIRRKFADGTVVEGWHEHLWDDRYRDKIGRPFTVPIGCADDLESMLIHACQYWNINIISRQDRRLEVNRNADD